MPGKEARIMAFSDDVFPPDDQCEICGARLDDEIVIQEFADGSLARLCNECAAGAALGTEEHLGHDLSRAVPESPALADSDPLERTRELLTPVVDLIGLQREMQAALERLAASLETFAAGVLTENLDKTATVEDRVQTLERELELTRARLLEAEALLGAAAISPASAEPDAVMAAPGVGVAAPAATAPAVAAAPAVEAAPSVEAAPEPVAPAILPAPVPEPEVVPPTALAEGAESTWPGAATSAT
jgi:ribosome-binding protein aMBF1 (putative translation factor)